jgi:hypothetical protein
MAAHLLALRLHLAALKAAVLRLAHLLAVLHAFGPHLLALLVLTRLSEALHLHALAAAVALDTLDLHARAAAVTAATRRLEVRTATTVAATATIGLHARAAATVTAATTVAATAAMRNRLGLAATAVRVAAAMPATGLRYSRGRDRQSGDARSEE